MSTTSPYIGRREGIGIGIEGAPGTAVAPQVSVRWLDNGLQNKTKVIENESAMGVVDRVNDSEVVEKWSEGTIGGKLTSQVAGFLLLGMFGSVSTSAPAGGIYTHTFSTNQSAVPTALTFTRITPLSTQRHSYGVLDNLEFKAEKGEWITVSSAVKARVGADSADSIAFTTEKEFTSKHINVRVAADVPSLSGATPIKALSTTLTMERKSDAFFPLGTDDTPEFQRGAFEARGEFVIQQTDTQYETDFLSNAIKAMKISIANGNESLEFTAARVRYRELEKSVDRDGVVTATVQFFCEFDTTTNASITPVLKNTRTSYVAS